MSIKERRRSSVTRTTITLHSPILKSGMNLEKVAQAITEEEGMLTVDQQNLLWQRFTPEDDRKAQLLEFICQKGDAGLEQFVRCLRTSGHTHLADMLQPETMNDSTAPAVSP